MNLNRSLPGAALCLGLLLLCKTATAVQPPSAEGLPGFLAVQEIVVAVADAGRLDGYVTIDASIEFQTAAQARSAEQWLPRIIDTWLRTVHGLSQRGYFRDRTVDPELMKRHLLQSTRASLEQLDPKDILLTRALYMKAR